MIRCRQHARRPRHTPDCRRRRLVERRSGNRTHRDRIGGGGDIADGVRYLNCKRTRARFRRRPADHAGARIQRQSNRKRS